MQFTPGATFGRYRIEIVLGRGGMGEVFRARDTVLDRQVALKVLHVDPTAASDETTGGTARLMREARAAAAIDHPNAVAIFDVGELEGSMFLAMELIEGSTLRAFVGDPSVSISDRVGWMASVASALAAAHRRGIVHRDVKPENIMVRTDGLVKVLDFGIARALRADAQPDAATTPALATITRDGLIVGTPLYMAPEHMRGETIDGRADQFAWGLVAYELLTGALPWAGPGGTLQLLATMLSREPTPLRERNPLVSLEIADVVHRAIAKDPASRWPNMASLLEALAVARGGERPITAPQSVSIRAGRSSPEAFAPTQFEAVSTGASRTRDRWRKRVAGVAALAGLGALAAVGLLLVGPRRTSTAPDAAPRAPELATANREAINAYQVGLQAERDGSWRLALKSYREAIAVDPRFAQAHLHAYVLGSQHLEQDVAESGRRARELVPLLDESDKLLLEALDPLARTPPDRREADRRITLIVERTSDPAATLRLQCRLRFLSGDFTRAVEACDAALARGPSAAALWAKARALPYLDDVGGATRALDECVRSAPRATACIEDLAILASQAGACDRVEAFGRQMITLETGSPAGYRLLAGALRAQRRPTEAVRGALGASYVRMSPSERALLEPLDSAALALLDGDFNGAEATLRRWEAQALPTNDERTIFEARQVLAELLLETGRPKDAAALAEDTLRRRSGWALEKTWDMSIVWDTTLYQAGALAKPAFSAKRAAWIEGALAGAVTQVGKQHPAARASTWVFGYATAVTTGEDAREAVEALPAYGTVTVLATTPRYDALTGSAYQRAGRPRDALPFLERVAFGCEPLTEALHTLRAAVELGAAREALGEKREACAAYARVPVDPSGRSGMATAARVARRRLACP